MTGQLSFDDALFAGEPQPDRVPDRTDPLALDAESVGLDRTHEDGMAAASTSFVVDVIRSPKRKKTSQARLRGNVLEVRIPAWISADQERETVTHFVEKFERSRSSQRIDLTVRARQLAVAFDLPEVRHISWVSNQRDRWGSCTPNHGTIRLSDRMADFPGWVIDYVIVHELAHLLEANHGPEFWAIVHRYQLTERARGYLIAKGHEGV